MPRHSKKHIRFTLNGEQTEVAFAPHKTLLEVLREDLNLTGTKHGCELGECGTCAVLVDGRSILSCLMLGLDAEGREVKTIEGMADGAELHPLQQTFADLGAAQCGYCSPGFLLVAEELLKKKPNPTRAEIQEALSGNLCRCTGYIKIYEAVELAAARMRGEEYGTAEGKCLRTRLEIRVICANLWTKRLLNIVGKPFRKVDARAKCVGQTKFADDIVLPRMLFCKILRSHLPHALIKSIDVSKALALPGVFAVITGKDLPIPYGILPVSQDEHALCIDKVRFIGDPVAAVAAIDEDVAFDAMNLIEVEYEPLNTISTIEEAVLIDEPRIHEYGDGGNVHKKVSLEFGNVDEGFAEADLVREDTFFYEGNTHLPMEQHAAVAHFDSDGKITLWSSTQTPHYVHRALAKVLGLPASHIRVIATPNGGGFGGKSDPFNHEVAVCKLSMITGRPVKVTLTREEVFYCHRGRHPVLMKVKTGVKNDGAITAMHFQSFLDGGAYGSYGVASTFYTGALQTVTYDVPRYKFQGLRAFTNKPPCGPKRGHGTPQPRYALEVQLDKIAEQLRIDPVEIRRKHLVAPNSVTANYLRIGSMGLGKCIDKVVEGSRWKNAFRGIKAIGSCRLAKASGSLAVLISAALVCRFTGTTCRNQACSFDSIARVASA